MVQAGETAWPSAPDNSPLDLKALVQGFLTGRTNYYEHIKASLAIYISLRVVFSEMAFGSRIKPFARFGSRESFPFKAF